MPIRDAPELNARRIAIRDMWALGWSGGEIARQLGTTKGCIAGHVNRMGLPKRVTAMSIPRSIVPKPLPEKPVEPISRGLGLEDLKDGMCRWPTGETSPFVFCGAQTETHKTWCKFHQTIGFQKPLRQ